MKFPGQKISVNEFLLAETSKDLIFLAALSPVAVKLDQFLAHQA
jgi:hypothetical protein